MPRCAFPHCRHAPVILAETEDMPMETPVQSPSFIDQIADANCASNVQGAPVALPFYERLRAYHS